MTAAATAARTRMPVGMLGEIIERAYYFHTHPSFFGG